MEIKKVLRPKDLLSLDEALNVKGGLNQSFENSVLCTCDCIGSNKNRVKPTNPTTK